MTEPGPSGLRITIKLGEQLDVSVHQDAKLNAPTFVTSSGNCPATS